MRETDQNPVFSMWSFHPQETAPWQGRDLLYPPYYHRAPTNPPANTIKGAASGGCVGMMGSSLGRKRKRGGGHLSWSRLATTTAAATIMALTTTSGSTSSSTTTAFGASVAEISPISIPLKTKPYYYGATQHHDRVSTGSPIHAPPPATTAAATAAAAAAAAAAAV